MLEIRLARVRVEALDVARLAGVAVFLGPGKGKLGSRPSLRFSRSPIIRRTISRGRRLEIEPGLAHVAEEGFIVIGVRARPAHTFPAFPSKSPRIPLNPKPR